VPESHRGKKSRNKIVKNIYRKGGRGREQVKEEKKREGEEKKKKKKKKIE